jgi:voltage-gated sodium channel
MERSKALARALTLKPFQFKETVRVLVEPDPALSRDDVRKKTSDSAASDFPRGPVRKKPTQRGLASPPVVKEDLSADSIPSEDDLVSSKQASPNDIAISHQTPGGHATKRAVDWVKEIIDSEEEQQAMIEARQRKSARRQLRALKKSLFDTSSTSGYWIHSMQADVVFACVIILNAGYLGADVEFNTSSPQCMNAWGVAETVFLAIFTVELLLRFIAERHRFFCVAWNNFDFVIVVFCAVDRVSTCLPKTDDESEAGGGAGNAVSILRLVRIVRIFRVLRVLRLFRFLRELLLLAKGIIGALRALFWSMLFLALVVYVFAIYFTTFVGKASDDPQVRVWFSTLPRSLFTLFVVLTLDEWPTLALDTMDATTSTVGIIFIMFVFVTNLTLLNLVTGVILENVMSISKSEKSDETEEEQAKKIKTMKTIFSIFRAIDTDGSETITIDEFRDALLTNEVKFKLTQVEIPPYEAEDLFMLLDVDQNGTVSCDEFMEGCMRVNGDAKAKHLLALQYDVQRVHKSLYEQSRDLNRILRFLRNTVRGTYGLSGLKGSKDGVKEADAGAGSAPDQDQGCGVATAQITDLRPARSQGLSQTERDEFNELWSTEDGARTQIRDQVSSAVGPLSKRLRDLVERQQQAAQTLEHASYVHDEWSDPSDPG